MQFSINKGISWAVDGAMVLGLLLLIFPEMQGYLTFDRVVQVVSAAGTVGAVWWAVLHADHVRVEQSRRELDAASLHACGFLLHVEDAVEQLNDAIARVDEAPPPVEYWGRQEEPDPIHEARRKFAEQQERLSKALDLELCKMGADEVSLLVALPNQCAHHLHMGIVVANRLQATLQENGIFNTEDDQLPALAHSWYAQAGIAAQHFSTALVTIREATRKVQLPRA